MKDSSDAEAEEQTSEHRYCIWLPTCFTDKLAAPWNKTSEAITLQQFHTEAVLMPFFITQKCSCLLLAGTNTHLHLELYKNNCMDTMLVYPAGKGSPLPPEIIIHYAANVGKKEVANLWNVKNKQYYSKELKLVYISYWLIWIHNKLWHIMN